MYKFCYAHFVVYKHISFYFLFKKVKRFLFFLFQAATVQCASPLTGLMDVVAVTLDRKADVSFSLVERVTYVLHVLYN